jgi:hypothetical protein
MYLMTTNETNACEEEYKTVQASLIAYMAYNHLDSVPGSVGTSDMTAPVRLYKSNTTSTNPSFAPNSQTRWMYAWDSTGRITRIASRAGGPYLMPGCNVSPP